MAMNFGAAFWVQRTGWPELRQAVLRAEAAGFDDLWIDDHLLSDEGDWRADKFEAWTTLAAVAAITERARLGLLVGANTLRNPGLTAKMVTTIDHVSGGRAILGIGAGWFEREHEAFGFDFGRSIGERLDRLAEAVPLMRRLLDGETVTHEGPFHRFAEAVCAPRPVQPHLPILIGGSGPKKTLPLIARSADLWNAYGTPDEVVAADVILRGACHLTTLIYRRRVSLAPLGSPLHASHEKTLGEDNDIRPTTRRNRADGRAPDGLRRIDAVGAALGGDHDSRRRAAHIPCHA